MYLTTVDLKMLFADYIYEFFFIGNILISCSNLLKTKITLSITHISFGRNIGCTCFDILDGRYFLLVQILWRTNFINTFPQSISFSNGCLP